MSSGRGKSNYIVEYENYIGSFDFILHCLVKDIEDFVKEDTSKMKTRIIICYFFNSQKIKKLQSKLNIFYIGFSMLLFVFLLI